MLVFELKGNFEQFGYKFRYKFITKPFNAFSLILAKWLPCCSFDDSCAGQFLRVFMSMQQAVLIICSIIFIVFFIFLGFLCTKSKCLVLLLAPKPKKNLYLHLHFLSSHFHSRFRTRNSNSSCHCTFPRTNLHWLSRSTVHCRTLLLTVLRHPPQKHHSRHVTEESRYRQDHESATCFPRLESARVEVSVWHIAHCGCWI